MQRLYLILLYCFIMQISIAQDTYWVEFTDKYNSPYSISKPERYLGPQAIQRRLVQNIPFDSTDLPVNPQYIDSVIATGSQLVFQSKWLNGITVLTTTPAQINKIKNLPFVKHTELTHSNIIESKLSARKFPAINDSALHDVGSTAEQHQQIGLDYLHNAGFRGKGKRIAILDTGFPNIDNYADMFGADIAGTYNVSYKGKSVYDKQLHGHGANCFSIMATDIEHTYIGSAPEATYYLIVTEINESESLLEIDNWVRGAEIADSLGADILTSSLGYSEMDDESTSLKYEQLDGKTIRCSRAAALAAQKGMVVCISAGNEARKAWYHITAPADADGILSIGAVDNQGYHSSFSSYGPSADGRIKPTICARGTGTAIYNNGNVLNVNGTSFATPLAAGAVASLWSALPYLTAKEITQNIISTAQQHDNPDNILGYGIADFRKAYDGTTSLSLVQNNTTFRIYGCNPVIIENTNAETFKLQVVNLLGQVVIDLDSDSEQLTIPADNIGNGIYIFRCIDKNHAENHIKKL